MGIVTVPQSHLQHSAVRLRQLPGGQGQLPPGHVSHDAVPHCLPEHALVMVFGEMDSPGQGLHGELLPDPFLNHVQGTEYGGSVMHILAFLPLSRLRPKPWNPCADPVDGTPGIPGLGCVSLQSQDTPPVAFFLDRKCCPGEIMAGETESPLRRDPVYGRACGRIPGRGLCRARSP